MVNKMASVADKYQMRRRTAGANLWVGYPGEAPERLAQLTARPVNYEILPTEEAVGRAMWEEIVAAAQATEDDLTIVLLGGRGAQALHRLMGQMAQTNETDALLGRLKVFTQDALAPLRMDNSLSFVRDFERLLGPDFFRKVKSFTAMQTDAVDLADEVARYAAKLLAGGGADIFFLGLGPEAEAASHLAYIKPNSGATVCDLAGVIPLSDSILEHHIAKFKDGGSAVSLADETECRAATHILTLGPAAILGAKRIVQAVVDASAAPAKRASYRRFLDEEIASDPKLRAAQCDANPGLWLRFHPNVRALLLPDVLGT